VNSSKTYYDAVKFEFQHRWSGGLQMLASFTISKYIDYTSGRESWVQSGGGNYVPQDYHNLAAEKSLDFNDIPKSLVVSFIYQLPFGHGQKFGSSMNKVADAVVGGWQFSGIASFKDGFPLSTAASTDNSGSRGGQLRPNCVGDPSASNPTVEMWINPAAFEQPADYTFGNCPRTLPHTRAMGINNWDTTLQKWFRQGERVKVQFRAEFFNMFNRTYLYQPNMRFSTAPGNTFGQIFNSGPSRDIQLGLKIYW